MAMQDYQKLLEKLQENKKWPLLYMFKFIAPNEEGKVEQVASLLPKNGKISYKHTKNLKFVSVTCVVHMPDAQSIIDITIEVNQIKGIIVL